MGQAGGQVSMAGAVRKSGAGARLGWWWLHNWMKFMEAGRGAYVHAHATLFLTAEDAEGAESRSKGVVTPQQKSLSASLSELCELCGENLKPAGTANSARASAS